MHRSLRILLFSLCSASLVFSGDLPPAMQVRFIKILLQTSNLPLQVVTTDAELSAEFQKAAVALTSAAKAAWAKNSDEVKKYKSQGKLVICPSLDLLSSGAAIAALEEGGKPAVYIHKTHLQAANVVLSDSILKLAKYHTGN